MKGKVSWEVKLKKQGIKPIKSWEQAVKAPCVAVILGFRRKGKSALSWWLLERLHAKGKLTACCVGLPKRRRRLVPKWVKHFDDISKLPNNAIVLIDEAAVRFAARRFTSDPNVMMQALVAVSGQKNQIILFVAHVSRLLDVESIMDSDIVIFKMPSLAHVKFERREIAGYTKEAWGQLVQKTNPKRWAWIVDFHEGRRGLLSNGLPSFWSDGLSHAWADLALESLKFKKEGNNKVAPRFGDFR